MQLGSETTGVLLAVAILLALVAAGLSLVAIAGQRRVRAAYRAFGGKSGLREDVLTLLQRHVEEVGALRDDVWGLRRYSDDLRELVAASLSRVHTVRYDAFDDMGGRLSFSSALLDEQGNGVVITSINGRSETRTYAKPVQGGVSRHNLSDEEAQAVAAALSGQTPGGEAQLRSRRPQAKVISDVG